MILNSVIVATKILPEVVVENTIKQTTISQRLLNDQNIKMVKKSMYWKEQPCL